MRWPSRSYACTSNTRFVVRSDELLNSKYSRSAIGAEGPILIPSIIPGIFDSQQRSREVCVFPLVWERSKGRCGHSIHEAISVRRRAATDLPLSPMAGAFTTNSSCTVEAIGRGGRGCGSPVKCFVVLTGKPSRSKGRCDERRTKRCCDCLLRPGSLSWSPAKGWLPSRLRPEKSQQKTKQTRVQAGVNTPRRTWHNPPPPLRRGVRTS